MKIKYIPREFLRALLRPFGYDVVSELEKIDYIIHEYENYEEYRKIQIFHNKRKIDLVWADEDTLTTIYHELKGGRSNPINGICHGTRNGFEQKIFNALPDCSAIGTEISDNAETFTDTIEWDFHNQNPDWIGQFDFVYSNSHDQAWKPRQALVSWLNQLKTDGELVLEHTHGHGPVATSKMDPFGVRPTVLPFVLSEWFGQQISIRFVKTSKELLQKKGIKNIDVWIFFVKKNVETVV